MGDEDPNASGHMDGDGWRWMEMDGDGWRWMEMDGDGWRWMEMDGDGCADIWIHTHHKYTHVYVCIYYVYTVYIYIIFESRGTVEHLLNVFLP